MSFPSPGEIHTVQFNLFVFSSPLPSGHISDGECKCGLNKLKEGHLFCSASILAFMWPKVALLAVLWQPHTTEEGDRPNHEMT